MLIFDLYPVTIHGQRALTLKEAAYLIRQYAIDHNDLRGWKLTSMLRNAESPSEIERAEKELHAWIQTKHQDQDSEFVKLHRGAQWSTLHESLLMAGPCSPFDHWLGEGTPHANTQARDKTLSVVPRSI